MDLLLRVTRLAKVTCEFEFEVGPGGGEDGGWEARIPAEGGWGRYRSLQDVQAEEEEEISQRPKTYSLEQIPPSTLASRYTASDLRTLSLLAYFHAVFPVPPSVASLPGSLSASPLATRWDFSVPLVARRPWAVDPTKAFKNGVFLVGPGAEEVEAPLVWRALEGGIVGLVAVEEETDGSGPSSLYVQGRAAPAPAQSHLLGLALVHSLVPSGLDSPTSTSPPPSALLISTPIPPFVLPQARAIVKGETELPLAGMLDWRAPAVAADEVCGVAREDAPFLEWRGQGEGVVGAGRRKVRKNVGRRGGG